MGACICENCKNNSVDIKKNENTDVNQTSSLCTEISLSVIKSNNSSIAVLSNKPILNRLIMKNKKVNWI